MPTLKHVLAETTDGVTLDFGAMGIPITPDLESAIFGAVPKLPPLTVRVAPAQDHRGEGWRSPTDGQPVAVANMVFDGFEQNIVHNNAPGQPLTLTNVRSMNAWRSSPAEAFEGQGLYLNNCGPVTVRGCLFGWNGWRAGKPLPARNMFRHGLYQDMSAGPLTVEDSIFIGNSNAGVQIRAGAVIRRCVFIDNAISILAVKGPVTIEDCVIYDGHRYTETNGPTPLGFQGNAGISAWTPVTLNNVLVVGRPGQDTPTPGFPVKSFNIGGITTARHHPKNPAGVGSVQASNTRVIGWPTPSQGAAAMNNVSGVVVDGTPISFDPMPTVNRYLQNIVDGPTAVQELSSALRAMVGN